jgi:branched-chain amino acid transport system permease protein
MSAAARNVLLFAAVGALIALTGFTQSWNAALAIVNMGLISAVMALGVNISWGYAGLYNVGTMGFVALGGLATVLVASQPTEGAWQAGGFRILTALVFGALVIAAASWAYKALPHGRRRFAALAALLVAGFYAYRLILDPAVTAVEAIRPALQGNLGGLGLPVLLSWPVGGLLAAGAGWLIGKTALGLRSDYLAIATLGIAEIVIAVLKNEDWLDRGVKNPLSFPSCRASAPIRARPRASW